MNYDPTPSFHSRHESEQLAKIVSSLAENSTIVEIGTFLGGTANLIRKNASPSVNVYSIDINQNILNTKKEMADRNIFFLNGTSREITKTWNNDVDLLFIDGGHRLIDTVNDFNNWAKNLDINTTIAFHDYDEAIAGGIYYIGVKTVVDTLIRKGVINNIEHNTSLLTAKIAVEHAKKIEAQDLIETICMQMNNISCVKKNLSDKLFEWFKNGCQTKSSDMFDKSITKSNVSIFRGKSEVHPICSMLNQMQFCYIFADWIKYNTAEAIKFSGRSDLTLYLEMMLWIDAERRANYPFECSYSDIFSKDEYPESIKNYKLKTIEDIGRFSTLEQVRLNMLSRISNSLFDKIIEKW